MSAARQAHVTSATDFPVSDLVVTVGEIERTVQLIITRGGWKGGARDVLCNEFANRDTAAQLRVLADHLDTISWENQT